MKRLLIGGAAAVLGLAAAPAAAQPAPPPPPGVAQGTTPALAPPHMERSMHAHLMSDRTITRDEVVRRVRELFARFDTNHDGFLTKDEIEAAHSAIMHMRMDMQNRTGWHAMGMGGPGAMFDRIDTNHDGVISRQEFMAAHSKMRERHIAMMRNGNAQVHMHGMDMGMGARLLASADTNHDGRVSLREAESAALARFDRADLNHDGKLTPDERRAARRQLMRRPQRPG